MFETGTTSRTDSRLPNSNSAVSQWPSRWDDLWRGVVVRRRNSCQTRSGLRLAGRITPRHWLPVFRAGVEMPRDWRDWVAVGEVVVPTSKGRASTPAAVPCHDRQGGMCVDSGHPPRRASSCRLCDSRELGAFPAGSLFSRTASLFSELCYEVASLSTRTRGQTDREKPGKGDTIYYH